jgi:hypothetical protein
MLTFTQSTDTYHGLIRANKDQPSEWYWVMCFGALLLYFGTLDATMLQENSCIGISKPSITHKACRGIDLSYLHAGIYSVKKQKKNIWYV